jgi:hypothetical protein
MHAAIAFPPTDLLQIEREVWTELSRAAYMPAHEWRRMVMSTLADDGWPDSRLMVVRECQPEERRLLIYTDARSLKARQLQADGRATLVAWSSTLGWQLRMRCHIEVITSGLSVASRWARIRLTPAAQDYLFPVAPGSDLSEMPPAPDDWGDAPSAAMDAYPHPNTVAHHHFAVLSVTVQRLDWLALTAQGHRRARFDAPGKGRWIAP